MPIRFRRSFNIFPGVKVNVSKGGFSISVGKRGATLNFSKRGVRQTVGIPGSGLSESSYIIKNKTDDESEKEKDDRPAKKSSSEAEERNDAPETESRRRGAPAWVLLIGIVVIYIGAVVLGIVPVDFLSQLLSQLTNWARQVGL
jgi:hypothetical protein